MGGSTVLEILVILSTDRSFQGCARFTNSPDGIAGGIWFDIPGYIAGPPGVGMGIDGPPCGYCV